MSAHGSRSAKAYHHAPDKPQVISDKKWELSKTPKSIEHSSNYRFLTHQKCPQIKCYYQNSVYCIKLYESQILFELNTSQNIFTAYIENDIIQKTDFLELLLHIQSKFNKKYFDIIGKLKTNICFIDKMQNSIISTIKSMPEIRTSLLGAVSVECMKLISMGYIRMNFKGDIAKEIEALIFDYYCIHNDTQFYCQSAEKIKVTNDHYIIKHNALNSNQHVIVSHFRLTNNGHYVFKVRAIQAVPYNEVCIMQCSWKLIDFLKQCNYAPLGDQCEQFWNDPKSPIVHGMAYIKNKDLLELRLIDKGSNMFIMEVHRNGSLDQRKVIRMDWKNGPFYPCVLFGNHSKTHHSNHWQSLAEFHILK